MTTGTTYDVIIAGGGLAGLTLSIQLVRKGYSVTLIEKERYPFHRVCGEYISLESWDFLKRLDVDLESLNVATIKKLQVSAENGRMMQQPLPLGGFGISRYLLDHTLARIARSAGVQIVEGARVDNIVFDGDGFIVTTPAASYRSAVVCGCLGKRSNIDVKWKRPFIIAPKNKLNNYIGIKYHVRAHFPIDTIALHNFKNGYCGVVKIEDDRYCLCYMTIAGNLQQADGDIHKMEQSILSRNPYLKKILKNCERVFDTPVTISQISFDKKKQVENHVLMIGDSAGMITPLCGNGMSMAMHGGKIAAEQVVLFLEKKITREEMEKGYERQWQKQFAARLRTGRHIQRLISNPVMTNIFITLASPFPGLLRWMIRKTHGQPF